MFRRADVALYRVKIQGGNAYAFGAAPEVDATPAPKGENEVAELALYPPDDLPSITA